MIGQSLTLPHAALPHPPLSPSLPRKTVKTILIADGNSTALENLERLFRGQGYDVIGLSDSTHLDECVGLHQPDCILLDLAVPGPFGLSSIGRIARRHPRVPIIVTSRFASIATAVQAIKSGAADFLAKPCPVADLVARVALMTAHSPSPHARPARDGCGLERLTGREQEVLIHIARGASSKEAGRRLGISPRTVDVHRARIKEKLRVRRMIDLVRLVRDADIHAIG